MEDNDSWLKNYIHNNLHYLYYFANIINEQEFAEKLETVDFIKRENIMGVLARKIEQQGINKGIEKGRAEGKIEVAKAMLNADSDIQFITKVTGITKEEINELK